MNSTKLNFKSKNRTLNLPKRYSINLAEETGIHIGDGSMNIYKKHNVNSYTYSGHAIDDLEFSEYVKNLMKSLYNLDPSYKRIQKNTIMLSYTRKGLVQFKQKLGLPLGNKGKIRIPRWIMNDKDLKIACIKGIFATDGCLQFQKKYRDRPYYPQLKISSKSKPLIIQISSSLNKLGIKSSISCNRRLSMRNPNKIWNTYIYGNRNLKEFVEAIGFSNPKHIKKYLQWKKQMPEAVHPS